MLADGGVMMTTGLRDGLGVVGEGGRRVGVEVGGLTGVAALAVGGIGAVVVIGGVVAVADMSVVRAGVGVDTADGGPADEQLAVSARTARAKTVTAAAAGLRRDIGRVVSTGRSPVVPGRAGGRSGAGGGERCRAVTADDVGSSAIDQTVARRRWITPHRGREAADLHGDSESTAGTLAQQPSSAPARYRRPTTEANVAMGSPGASP